MGTYETSSKTRSKGTAIRHYWSNILPGQIPGQMRNTPNKRHFSADLMCILCRFGRFNHTRNSKPETKNSKPTPFHPQFQHLHSPTLCLHAHEIQASWQAVQIEAEQTGRDLRHLVLFHQNAPHVRQAHGAGLTFAGRQVEPSLLVRGVGKE